MFSIIKSLFALFGLSCAIFVVALLLTYRIEPSEDEIVLRKREAIGSPFEAIEKAKDTLIKSNPFAKEPSRDKEPAESIEEPENKPAPKAEAKPAPKPEPKPEAKAKPKPAEPQDPDGLTTKDRGDLDTLLKNKLKKK